MEFTRSYRGFGRPSKKRSNKGKSEHESGKSIIRETTPKTIKDCKVVLPSLSTSILSTVQLVKKNNEMENTTNLAAVHSDIKRPIFLGDLIIGYETVSPKITATKTKSKTKQRILKRKERLLTNENDLSPIVINQTSVVIPDEKGKKRRVNLRKIAKMEEDEVKQKRRKLKSLQEVPAVGKTPHDELNISESLSPKPWTCFKETETIKTNKETVISGKEKKCEPKSVDNLKGIGAADDIAQDFNRESMLWGGNTKYDETDRVLCTIPKNKDNPFLFGKFDCSKSHESCDSEGTPEPTLFPLLPQNSSMEECTDFSEVPVEPPLREESGNPVLPVDEGSIDDVVPVTNADEETTASGLEIERESCNICGQEVDPIEKPATFMEVTEENLIYYICFTCNQKFSIIECAKHERECFVKKEEECYYPAYEASELEELLPPNNHETGFRMVACHTCVLAMKGL